MLGPAVDARPGVFRMLSFQKFRRTAGIFDYFNAAPQFAHSIVDDFAVFFGKQCRYLAYVLLQQLLKGKSIILVRWTSNHLCRKMNDFGFYQIGKIGILHLYQFGM